MSSPSLSSFSSFCQSYELNDPVVYASLSPDSHRFFGHSPSNFPFEQLPLPEAHNFAGYPFMNPDPGCYPEFSCSTQTDLHPYAYPQSLAYAQTLAISPRLSNSSMDFAPAFSENSSPDFSASDITTSFLFPQAHGQFTDVGNEYPYVEPENSLPLLNLQAPRCSFSSNITEVAITEAPVMQSQQSWRATEQAITTPEPKSKRKATTSKRALPASTAQSNSHPIVPTPRTKSDQPQRAKRATRSSHLILTDSPVSVTQGGYARKYACTWDGCGKAFTTSGHLVRHKRIHTGEKRYECAMENCTSRFSRQDNMLQHYRTHFSSKSRRISSPSYVTPNNSTPTIDPSNIINPAMSVPQLGSFGQIFVGHSSI